MSGHSRWAQIKHKKAASDAKKGKLFSRLSRLITLAAKELGPDPKTNSKLAAAIEEARGANMPQENIARAIKRAGEKESADLKAVLYEAYGPGATALIISAVTDNPNRTLNEIKHILSENDAKLGVEGSASWAFEKRGKPASNASRSDVGWDFVPKFPQALSREDSKKFEALLEALSDHDDVEEVWSNAEVRQ